MTLSDDDRNWLADVNGCIKALLEAQDVEYYNGYGWCPKIGVGFERGTRYRIRPKSPEKKWRPYTAEEMIQRVGSRVRPKDRHQSITTILSFANPWASLFPFSVASQSIRVTAEGLLDGYVWIDGTPCGVYE